MTSDCSECGIAQNSASPFGSSSPSTAACVAVLVLLSGVLYFVNAGSLPVIEPEEARCALTVQGMLQSGNYLVPTLGCDVVVENGQTVVKPRPYFDKPASFFWLAAAGQKLTGSIELGGRLVAGIAGILGVLGVFGIARRIGGNWAGLVAGVVLASGVEYLFLARWYRMDMPFAAAMVLALWWYWRYEGVDTTAGRRGLRWCGFYAFCGVATALKGPAGLLLPLIIVLGHRVLLGRWRQVGSALLWMLPGLLVFAAVAAPPFVMCEMASPGSMREFFVEQNLVRFSQAGAVDRHHPPAVIYLAILAGGLGPWVVYLPGAVMRCLPWRREGRLTARPEFLFVWLMAAAPLAFFMAASTRLPNYILPCFPGFAILLSLPLAKWMGEGNDRLYVHGGRAMAIVLLVLAAGLAGTEFVLPKILDALANGVQLHMKQWMDRSSTNVDVWTAVMAAGVALAAAGAMVALQKNRRKAFFACSVAGTATILLYVILHVMPVVYDFKSNRELGRQVAPMLGAEANLVCWEEERFSFPIYAGKTQSPPLQARYDRDRQRLAALVGSGQELFAMAPAVKFDSRSTPAEMLANLEKVSGRPFEKVAADGRFAVYRMLPAGGATGACSQPASAAAMK